MAAAEPLSWAPCAFEAVAMITTLHLGKLAVLPAISQASESLTQKDQHAPPDRLATPTSAKYEQPVPMHNNMVSCKLAKTSCCRTPTAHACTEAQICCCSCSWQLHNVVVHAQESVAADKTFSELCITSEQPRSTSSPSRSASRCR